MSSVKTVLVGAGRWGTNIARALKELEVEGLVELSYVVDIDISRALELSKKYGFRAAASRICESSGEAFIIATPISALYQNALEAMNAASCVFIEKPAAETYEEANYLLTLANARGIVHQVGYLSRFDSTIVELKQQIRDRYVYALRFRRLSRRPHYMRSYPVTLDLMSHDIDLAFYMLNPRKVRPLFSLFAVDSGVPQRAVAEVIYDGADVVFEADGILPVKVREVDVLTDQGIIRADLVSKMLTVATEIGKTQIRTSDREPLKEELRVFIERCRGKDIEAPDLRDAAAVLKVIDELTRVANKM
ncbi:MAG: Gfo/Idh/MocA family oxidoreductase [Sulfolobales archaeon]